MAKDNSQFITDDSSLLIYQSDDGLIKIETHLENETVWLTLEQMAKFFQKGKSTINEHVLNIFKEGELVEDEVKRKIGISDFSTKPTNFYNLDVIISVGYRVKSIVQNLHITVKTALVSFFYNLYYQKSNIIVWQKNGIL